MVDIISPIIAFGLGGSLVKTIIDWMKLRQENRLAYQNYDFQIRLQEAQHEHELLLARIRSREPDVTIKVVGSGNHSSRDLLVEADNQPTHRLHAGESDNFPEHLNMEAELLCDRGFNVVLDPVNDGYGLELVVREDLTLGFWLPPTYPHQAPKVFIITYTEIDHIDFEPDAWQPDHNIWEVVEAIKAGY